MAGWTPLSAADQLALFLRDQLIRGRWRIDMPGVHRLAADLRVNRKTVEAALRQLEREGILVSRGAGRRRKIVVPESSPSMKLRVAILPYEPSDVRLHYLVEMQSLLKESGITPILADRTLVELRMNRSRVERMVENMTADAWVVVSGSRDILEWFSKQSVPAFAMFGRRSGLPLAGVGPDKAAQYAAVARRLVELGHDRIVLLERQGRFSAGPGDVDRALLGELSRHGLSTGTYNIPDWEASPEGLSHLLDELYRITPPTAFLIDEAFLFIAVQQHLARRGILAPEQVSLVCTDPDPTFAWCRPTVAHIRWEPSDVVQRVLQWSRNVARGKSDLRQSFTPADFVEGGTIGPARG